MSVVTPDQAPAPTTRPDVITPHRPPQPSRSPTKGTSVALVTLFVFTVIFGVAGAASVFFDQTQRNDAGFLMEDDSYHLSTGGAAIAANPARIFDWGGHVEPFRHLVGDVDVTVENNQEDPVFVGLARTDHVRRYLDSIGHSDWSLDHSDVVLKDHAGPAADGSPIDQDFWTQSVTGTGSQSLHIDPREGRWTVVVMNADGTSGIDARASIGAELSSLAWIGPTLLGVALVTGSAATVLLLTSRRPRGEG